MHKRTHKLRALRADARQILASSRSIAEASRRLGVNRSTVHRWIEAGKLPRPAGSAKTPTRAGSVPASDGASFAAWARDTFELTRAEHELVGLAQQALDLAHDPTATAATRLQAMAQFRACLRDLRLPTEDEAHDGNLQTPNVTRFPRRIG
ncbi:MAG TPA: MerR family DNA-binding transcriptional regulator [Vicinamibacterales bacterium]